GPAQRQAARQQQGRRRRTEGRQRGARAGLGRCAEVHGRPTGEEGRRRARSSGQHLRLRKSRMSVRTLITEAGRAGMRTCRSGADETPSGQRAAEAASDAVAAPSRRRLLLAGGGLAALLVSGCGFRLRGPQALDFATVHINTPPETELGAQLRRLIATSGTTTVVEDAEQAE